jgi:hypothetical protein
MNLPWTMRKLLLKNSFAKQDRHRDEAAIQSLLGSAKGQLKQLRGRAMRHLAGLLLIALISLTQETSADPIKDSEMQRVVADKICPSDRTPVALIIQHKVCGGDGTHSPCGSTDTDCHKRTVACGNEVTKQNQLINAYNARLRECDAGRSSGGASNSVKTAPARPDPQGGASTSDDFADRLQKAKKRSRDDEEHVKQDAARADRDVKNLIAKEKDFR